MARLVPIDRMRNTGKAWRRPTGYGWVTKDGLLPLGWSEFAQATLAMPIGFAEQGGRYVPVALLTLAPGDNLFVGLNREWLGGYIPAVLRVYPFGLIREPGSELATVSIDEDSGLVVDETSENVEKFFEADGTPTATTNSIAEFLRYTEQDRTKVDLSVAALADAGVIKPWPVTVPVGNQNVTVNGLHHVDEAAFNALSDESFAKLRKASALVVAFGQMFSAGQLGLLSRMSLIRQQMAKATAGTPPE
jgi:hypothetical protein